jgi:hypothetical protein
MAVSPPQLVDARNRSTTRLVDNNVLANHS